MNRLHPQAIATAMIISLALDVVGGVVLVGMFGSVFGGRIESNMTPEQVEAAIRQITGTTEFLMTSLVYGMGTTLIGGYIAARLARSHPYFNALAVGVAGIVISLLLADDTPWWFDLLGFVMTLPVAVAGGHLFVRSKPPHNN